LIQVKKPHQTAWWKIFNDPKLIAINEKAYEQQRKTVKPWRNEPSGVVCCNRLSAGKSATFKSVQNMIH
jgi:hypothetical protein